MSAVAAGRRRDAVRSRELLLQAATGLFAERGFDRTTVREIAERAGVDAALIARYYDGKAGLYIATLRAQAGDGSFRDLLQLDRLTELLDRLSRHGAGPILQAAVREHDDPAIREAARTDLHDRLVAPLQARFESEGLDRPELRAEVAVAAFAGVVFGRTSGAFPELADVSLDTVVALTRQVLEGAATAEV
ncbi:MAG TPA: helix-turn-helix domain-containing protein [Mycobacteriales bacterium]|jgi:AcrR family transcriptional regulator|nr:helix-turn-helix domain-containing protein [Mycobacteriales bacterium]